MNIKESDEAVQIANDLRQLQIERDVRSMVMGKKGYAAKQMGKKFLEANNADSWKAFCAEPENNLVYGTMNRYIHLYKIFGHNGLDISSEQWLKIGPRKLGIIAPHIGRPEFGEEGINGPCFNHNTFLLDMAETLSASDLIKEIKGEGAGGESATSTIVSPCELSGGVGGQPIGIEGMKALSPAQYKKLVKESPCCVCSREPPEIQIHSHHFPQTRNRGKDWKVIPLCGFCHQDAHHHPMEFLWQYKNNIFGWFYSGMVDDN